MNDTDRSAEPGAGIRDHEMDAVQLAGLERAQEGDPEGAVFAVADLDAKDFPVAVAGHAGGHDHRLAHDPASGAGLDVGGIEEHIGKLDALPWAGPGTRRGSRRAWRRSVDTSDLPNPDEAPEAATTSSTFRVQTP